ncbi:MAG TPA: ABC transporter substrate-binding protein [Stellaceae bacterium]|nr:ABC transporter substrate-binding protein [Stellaceae bacterium]
MMRRGWLLWAAMFAAVSTCGASAHALDKLRVGKAVPVWAFLALDIGAEQGIYQKYGIALEITDMGSAAKLQEALASGTLDLGLTSGADLAFPAKGAPVRAVAAFADAPLAVTVLAMDDSPIKGVADLKGKTLAIPGVGSSPEWLVRQMSVQEGWGPDGIKTVAVGSISATMAALRAHQIDASVGSAEAGYVLEEKHEAHIVVRLAKYAPHFHAHLVFARNDLIAQNPQLIDRFLKAFFSSIAFIKGHREATDQAASRLMNLPISIVDRTYSEQLSMLQDGGTFDRQAIETLKQSFVDLGLLPTKPRDEQILTTRFFPVKD